MTPKENSLDLDIDSSTLHNLYCFVCGKKNENSLQLDAPFNTETGEISTTYTIAEKFVGLAGYSHGGVVASLVDETQGLLCTYLGYIVMTDKLDIKYHKAVPLGIELRLEAKITAVRRRRLYTMAKIYDAQGQELVESNAKWYIIPPRLLVKLSPEYEAEKEVIRDLLEKNRKRAKEIRRRLRQKSNRVTS